MHTYTRMGSTYTLTRISARARTRTSPKAQETALLIFQKLCRIPIFIKNANSISFVSEEICPNSAEPSLQRS